MFPGTVEADAEVTLRESLLVVDPDDPHSWLVTDTALRPMVEAVPLIGPIVPDATAPGGWRIEIRCRERPDVADLPASIHADVLLRDRASGREAPTEWGGIYYGPPPDFLNGGNYICYVRPWPTSSGELDDALTRFDVILRPDVAGMASRPGDERVWGREIVIPIVPVYRDAGRAAGDEWYGVGVASRRMDAAIAAARRIGRERRRGPPTLRTCPRATRSTGRHGTRRRCSPGSGSP